MGWQYANIGWRAINDCYELFLAIRHKNYTCSAFTTLGRTRTNVNKRLPAWPGPELCIDLNSFFVRRSFLAESNKPDFIFLRSLRK